MAYADFVKETTTTTGTGAVTLGGAVTGFQAFATAFANPTEVYYAIQTPGGSEWEVGFGVFTTTLSRDTVFASSNAGALVSFSAGTKQVSCVQPADAIADMGLTTAMGQNGMGAF